MRVRFSERQVGDDLTEFLRRSDCLVERIGARVLEINPRLPLLPEAARLEFPTAQGGRRWYPSTVRYTPGRAS